MTLTSLLLLLIIAGVCGALGRVLAGGPGGGYATSILLGLVGALVGNWLADHLADHMGIGQLYAIRIGSRPFPIIWAIVGAALSVSLLNMLTPDEQD